MRTQLIIYLLSLGASIGVTRNLSAQTNILESYVKEGLQNNLALKQEDFSVQKSWSALGEAKGLFLPSVSFQANYTLARGGRTIDLPLGDLLNPVYQTLNGLTDSNNFPTLENQSEQFLPNNFHETKLRVIQPIFNSDIYFNYKAQEELISVQQAQKRGYESELRKEIKVAYFQYMKTLRLLEVYQETDSLLREILRVNQRLVKNDRATPEIIYSAESEISDLEQQVARAEQDRQRAKAYFNFLLNRRLREEIVKDSLLLLKETDTYDLTSLDNQAIQKREELNQLQNAVAANEQLLKLNEFRKLPTLNAVGDVGFQGFGYNFDSSQDFWLVQFSLNWNIFSGRQQHYQTQRVKIEQDRLKTQYQELEQQIQLQVENAYYALEASKKAIEASQAALRSAERNFFLTRRKYEEGQTQYITLIDSRTRYSNQQITLTINQYDYLIRKAELERAVGQ